MEINVQYFSPFFLTFFAVESWIYLMQNSMKMFIFVLQKKSSGKLGLQWHGLIKMGSKLKTKKLWIGKYFLVLQVHRASPFWNIPQMNPFQPIR